MLNYKKLSMNLKKLVAILNDGQYHDGTCIGKKLKITRSAVWKIIQKLESYDITIQSIKGKGYALAEPLILLDKKLIQKNLIQKDIKIIIFERIDSTNAYLKLHTKNNNIYVCFAEHQFNGKGRLDRIWHSPFGLNLYCSCSYTFHKDMSELSGLSLVVSLAVRATLQAYLPASLKIKWPNDILYDHKKLSGILIEVNAESNGSSTAIIGIGINVNMISKKIDAILQPWISLRAISNQYIDRNALAASLINILLQYLTLFNLHGLKYFQQEWKLSDVLFNKNITLLHANTATTGRAIGINAHGLLLLKMKNNVIQAFSSGEVSVKKVKYTK